MILPIILICIGIAFAVEAIRYRGNGDVMWGFIIVCIIYFAVLTSIWGGIYYSNLSAIKKVEVFHQVGYKNYVQTIKETQNSLIELKNSAIPVENMEHSKQITERIKDLRDRVERFNRRLVSWRAYKENAFLSWFVPEISDHLEPLVIGEIMTE